MAVSLRDKEGKETYRIPKDIDNPIQGSLHLSNAGQDGLAHALNRRRNSSGTNSGFDTGGVGTLLAD